MTVNLLDFDAEGLTAWFAQQGDKPFRARQVLRWIHQRGEGDFNAMTDIAKSLREKLLATAAVSPAPTISDKLSDDGSRKFLFDVGNRNAVETVFIPEDDRGTLCVSSQAGCALECAFCSTGRQGFNRNLTTAEIIGPAQCAERAPGFYTVRPFAEQEGPLRRAGGSYARTTDWATRRCRRRATPRFPAPCGTSGGQPTQAR